MTDEHPSLPPRPADGHKGTFGTVCVLGGQAAGARVMVGGPAFAALGALRAGAGLAVLAVPRPIMPAALITAPSATGLALPVDERGALRPSEVAELLDEHLSSFSCLAIGPGFGAGVEQQQIIMRLIARDEIPIVVDADGLNAMAQVRDFDRDVRASTILTPHPGEYRRLADALGIKGDPIEPHLRREAAEVLAQRLGCIVVLKGAGTVVTDGLSTTVNETGGAALATAGTGDVLTGVIAGLVAQYAGLVSAAEPAPDLLHCARLGVYIHGLAADRWQERHGDAGLLAGDLLAEIPAAVAQLRCDAGEPIQ
jgi:NAD(P)H-hydrate epimerase